jgi:uncharacterized protein
MSLFISKKKINYYDYVLTMDDEIAFKEDENISKEYPKESVEKTIDTSTDIFDDVFGEDKEKIEARKKMSERAKELEEKMLKTRQKSENTSDSIYEENEDDPEIFPSVELNETQISKKEENPIDTDEKIKIPDEETNNNEKNNTEKEEDNINETDNEENNTKKEEDNINETDNEENNTDEESEKKKDYELRKRLGRIKQKSIVVGGASKDSVMGVEEKNIVIPKTKALPIEREIIKSVIKNKAKKYSNNVPIEENLIKEDGTTEEGTEESIIDEIKKPESKLKPNLDFLMSDQGNAFIGRKKSVLKQYGEECGLFIGRVQEEDKHHKHVYLDGLNPHVVFACGARGTGKSYVLGVLAEELAIKNKNIGLVVVDPIGVFWSMKHPNKENKELELLADWELMPRGLDNIKAFIPVGMVGSVPKSTYDSTFAIQPAMLTAEDWCLTFGIERFSPTGLLLDKGISKVKKGYTNIDGKQIRGKENTFSLEDMNKCFDTDAELNDRDKGYKADSIRALVSRFDAAKTWGIFDEKGTPLSMLSRAGQMTILDTSFLEDNVSALVVGILARRLLQARKLSTRREAAGKFAETTMEDLVELNVPPTWLFIDEAHTLIPGGNQKTPASNALVEYVKQGRRPGCSLVFATQQPSAIDPKVLSQLDIILVHKLVFDDDIKSITKRTPTIIPLAYKKPNFIKTLPMGVALTGDRQETTTRAFIMNVRPRMSQHEGRDAETVEVKHELEKDQVEKLASNIVMKQLEKDPAIAIETIEQTLDTLNHTYKQKVDMKKILDDLKKKGVVVSGEYVSIPGNEIEEKLTDQLEDELNENTPVKIDDDKEKFIEDNKKIIDDEELENEPNFDENVELVSLHESIDESNARKLLANFRLKKKLFLFGEEEILDRLSLKYAVIYHIKYKYSSHKDAFTVGEAYVNSLTGEFIHDVNGKLKESRGFKKLKRLNDAESSLLKLLNKKKSLDELSTRMNMQKGNVKRVIDSLIIKKLINISKNKDIEYYCLKEKLDLPLSPLHAILPSIGKRPLKEIESVSAIRPEFDENEISEMLKKLWGTVSVKEITEIYLPVWEGILKKKTGEERVIRIDAINGNKLN